MRAFVEELYGQPERAVPALCLLLGLTVGLLTKSVAWAFACTLCSAVVWRYWSARLVIEDLRLGALTLTCPQRDENNKAQVWLTFDDGPGPETLEIVEALNRAQTPATFFFIGEQVKNFPELDKLAQALRLGGHSVANHSYTHPNFLRLSSHRTRDQIESTQALLEETFQELVVPLFRPPYGYRSSLTLRTANDCGLTSVGWSVNSLDFLSGASQRVFERVSRECKPGSILLFHDGRSGRSRTVEALPLVLRRLNHLNFGAYSPR